MNNKVMPKRRFNIPVGVAIGLTFSALVIVICSGIIAYMASMERRKAGPLLEEYGRLMVQRGTRTVEKFFADQERLIILASRTSTNPVKTDTLLSSFPEGCRLSLNPVWSGEKIAGVSWSDFIFDEGAQTSVIIARMPLQTGGVLEVSYPTQVFESLLGVIRWRDDQAPFILKDKDTAVAITSSAGVDFQPMPGKPLPTLADLSTARLSALWSENPSVHIMPGTINGRVVPHSGKRYAIIYDEIAAGPAKGWIIGSVFRAENYGAVMNKRKVVAGAIAIAVLFGVGLSFWLGRALGRPLRQLASASSHVRELDFAEVEPLPRSRLAELDLVNTAFNGTLTALSAFSHYVPKELVKQLVDQGMTAPDRIETREMTIVFTDIAGFTNVASHLTAEETARFLNHHFEIVSDAITRENGTIDKYIGDGVMAFWGAPTAQPDHARQAVSSVIDLARRLEELEDPDIRLRIGIHTGRVVVGNIGSTSRMNYTVIGDPVNVAARLQEFGKSVDDKARIIALASGETIAALDGEKAFDNIGSTTLRGREVATDVYRIV